LNTYFDSKLHFVSIINNTVDVADNLSFAIIIVLTGLKSIAFN